VSNILTTNNRSEIMDLQLYNIAFAAYAQDASVNVRILISYLISAYLVSRTLSRIGGTKNVPIGHMDPYRKLL
jgi:hypothetical protein